MRGNPKGMLWPPRARQAWEPVSTPIAFGLYLFSWPEPGAAAATVGRRVNGSDDSASAWPLGRKPWPGGFPWHARASSAVRPIVLSGFSESFF